MVRKGDVVEGLPQWRDPGDEQFTWVAMADEEKGRIDVVPADHPLDIKPTSVMRTEWVRVIGTTLPRSTAG